jgi:hypothetical protein
MNSEKLQNIYELLNNRKIDSTKLANKISTFARETYQYVERAEKGKIELNFTFGELSIIATKIKTKLVKSIEKLSVSDNINEYNNSILLHSSYYLVVKSINMLKDMEAKAVSDETKD